MNGPYSGMRPDGGGSAFAPTLGVANWVLETVAGRLASVSEIGWGGEASTSTPMRTRVSYDTAVGTGARTALTVGQPPNAAANAAFLSATYGTTQPIIATAVLVGKAWNAYGGIFHWKAAPNEELMLISTLSLECRPDLGVGISSYDVHWFEQ